jgi:hypothetical protein
MQDGAFGAEVPEQARRGGGQQGQEEWRQGAEEQLQGGKEWRQGGEEWRQGGKNKRQRREGEPQERDAGRPTGQDGPLHCIQSGPGW